MTDKDKDTLKTGLIGGAILLGAIGIGTALLYAAKEISDDYAPKPMPEPDPEPTTDYSSYSSSYSSSVVPQYGYCSVHGENSEMCQRGTPHCIACNDGLGDSYFRWCEECDWDYRNNDSD